MRSQAFHSLDEGLGFGTCSFKVARRLSEALTSPTETRRRRSLSALAVLNARVTLSVRIRSSMRARCENVWGRALAASSVRTGAEATMMTVEMTW